MSIRMTILGLAAAAAVQAAPAAAQTRYFERAPSAEELERALTPQASPPASMAPFQQPPASPQDSSLTRRGAMAAPPPIGMTPPRPPEPPKVGLMVNFAFISADLTGEARQVLDVLAMAINRLPQFRFQIEGHTDAVGGDAFNLSLSQRRAAAVVQYLVLTHNVSPHRLAAIGFGKRKLRDAMHPNDGINRRVEVLNAGPV